MGGFILNLVQAYTDAFASNPYQIPEKTDARKQNVFGRDLSYINDRGIEVFLPVTLKNSTESITIDCCTIKMSGKKTTVFTPVYERKGSVKEEFDVNDYMFTVQGVLIGKDRNFPDDQIITLKNLYEGRETVEIENALTDLLIDKSRKVLISSIEFPEMKAKSLHHRSFVLELITDSIDSLQIL